MMLTIMRGEVGSATTFPSKDAALSNAQALFENTSEHAWEEVSEAVARGECVATDNSEWETVTIFPIRNNQSRVLEYDA